ncbi:HD domain-containing protein [Paraclostridium sp. AKS73]|uniref:HD domain-containing protein n=1 Tax=Paraclostridium sp. AKS73 TaxID=2876116 RepID=UPI002FCCC4F4
MNTSTFLEILTVAEKLKCNTRHSWTSSGRHESVAEHSWRIALMALLMRDEFPSIDMDKVIRMCLIHDLGEAFTGDIPAFDKKEEDSKKEDEIFYNGLKLFLLIIKRNL